MVGVGAVTVGWGVFVGMVMVGVIKVAEAEALNAKLLSDA